jgi:hypothetical protein
MYNQFRNMTYPSKYMIDVMKDGIQKGNTTLGQII